MNTSEVPPSRTRRSIPNSRSTSGGDNAEVGSSRMMMRAPDDSTRASSTSCCRPSGSELMAAAGSTSMPRRCRWALASRRIRRQSTSPARLSGCVPSMTFSATDSSGTMLSS